METERGTDTVWGGGEGTTHWKEHHGCSFVSNGCFRLCVKYAVKVHAMSG